MIQRSQIVPVHALLLVAGLALIPLGCSDSPPAAPVSAPVSQPVSAAPAKPLTAQEKREQQREFDNMGVKEKREWRKRQREAAGAGTP